MLDLHILTVPLAKREWEVQRDESIRVAVNQAGFPVEVHSLPGVVGHIGQGRAAGYRLGGHPYVTYVDADDYLLPSALSEMKGALEDGAEAIAPGETTVQNGIFRRHSYPHHLICYRRDVAEGFPMQEWVVCGDLALANSANLTRIESYGYVHRLYESAGRRLRRKHLQELAKANG